MKKKFNIKKGDLIKIVLDTWGTFWSKSGESFDYKIPRGTVTVAMSSISPLPGWEILELDVLIDSRIISLVLTTELSEIDFA